MPFHSWLTTTHSKNSWMVFMWCVIKVSFTARYWSAKALQHEWGCNSGTLKPKAKKWDILRLTLGQQEQISKEYARWRNWVWKKYRNIYNLPVPRRSAQWFYGKTIPSVDNLFALSRLFEMPMESILVEKHKENLGSKIEWNREEKYHIQFAERLRTYAIMTNLINSII